MAIDYKLFKTAILLLCLVRLSNSQSVSSIATNFCQEQGLDNFSCPTSPIEGAACFNRSELCNGELLCPFGEDEGSEFLTSLDCGLEGENSTFSCGNGVFIQLDALCNGVDDCGIAGGISGSDETLVLCDNKCLLPYYGGCPLSVRCENLREVAVCGNQGDCLSGYFSFQFRESDQSACIPFIDLTIDAPLGNNVSETTGFVELCVTATLRPDLEGISPDAIANSTFPVFAVDINATAVTSPVSLADYIVLEDSITLNPVTNPRDCFVITVIDDNMQEGDEVVTISVQLESEFSQQLQPSNFTEEITIVDDEMPNINLPEFGFTLATFTGSEGSGALQVTISILNGVVLEESVFVQFAAQLIIDDPNPAGIDDFIVDVQTVAFSPNSTFVMVSVLILDDLLVEDAESILLSLSQPSQGSIVEGNSISRGIILDNDAPQFGFNPPAYTFTESGSLQQIVVVITNGVVFQPGVFRSVQVNTQGGQATAGTDYVQVVNSDLEVGMSPFAFSVQILEDIIDEPSETFDLVLSANSSDVLIDPAFSIAAVTIADNDDPQFLFSLDNVVVVQENSTSVEVCLILILTVLSQPLGIPLILAGANSATIGDDFEGDVVVVLFPAQSSPGTELCVFISIIDDNIVEDTESFIITAALGAFPNGNTQTVNILDNDVPEFGFNCAPGMPITFTGDEAVETAEVTVGILNGVLLSMPSTLQLISLVNPNDVNPASTDDFLPGTENVTFSPNSTTLLVEILITEDQLIEDPESFVVVIASSSVGTINQENSTARIVILDNDDPVFGFSPTNYTFTESGNLEETTIVVTNEVAFQPGVTRPLRVNTVSLSGLRQATAGTDYERIVDSDQNVGSSPFTLFVQLLEDTTDEPPETFQVVLSSISDRVSVDLNFFATVTIVDDDDPLPEFQFSLRDIDALEDFPSFELCVQTLHEELSQPQVITLTFASGIGERAATIGDDFDGSEVSLVFSELDFEACAVINIVDDTIAEGTEFFTVTAVGGLFPDGNSENLTILDNDVAQFQFVTTELNVSESVSSAVVSVELTGNVLLGSPVAITVSSQNTGSALSFPVLPRQEDFTRNTCMLVFPAASQSGTTMDCSFAINDDGELERSENFNVSAIVMTTEVASFSQDMAIINIIDNDVALFQLFPPVITVTESSSASVEVIFVPGGASLLFDIAVTVAVTVQHISTSPEEDFFFDGCVQQFSFTEAGVSMSCSLTTIDDDIAEATEQVLLRGIILDPLGSAMFIQDTAVINILDNDGNTIDVFCDLDTTEIGDWPRTEAGSLATLTCPPPDDSANAATRLCGSAGVWLPENTTACSHLDTVENINSLLLSLSEDSIEIEIDDFARVLAQSVDEEVRQSEEVLERVTVYFIAVSETLVANFTGTNQTIPPMAVDGLVESINSLQQWEPDIPASSGNSSRIVMSFESVAREFAEQISSTMNFMEVGTIFVAENFVLSDLQIFGRLAVFLMNEDFRTGSAPTQGQNLALSSNALAAVSLPPSLFATITDRDPNDTIGIFFTFYEEATLFPIRPAVGAAPGSSAVQPQVASGIVGANVGPGLEFIDLSPTETVEIILRTINSFPVVRNGSEVCVSWDFGLAGGLGNWTTEGCETIALGGDEVMCRCNHLTNFAILVDICTRTSDCESNPPAVEVLLSVISYVGVSLSLFSLVVTIITLLFFNELRKRDVSKFHIQLSIAVFCMLLVFLAGLERTEEYGGCVAVSALIHYFSLASVLWMGAEAVLMFQKLVLIFKRVTRRLIVTTSLVCWTIPLVPVLIPLIIDLSSGPGSSNDLVVRRDRFCFLSDTRVFWAAFLGPVFAIVLFNGVIFVITTVVLVKHTRRSMARKNESLDKDKTILRLMLSIAGIMSLFGLSWLFGALTITVQEVRIAFEILFAIFTSLQGFFIFLFFCVFSQVARELWKETLSCGKYRSKILDPSLRFSRGRRYRPNGSHSNSSHAMTSKTTQETDLTLPRPRPSSDADDCSQHDAGQDLQDNGGELASPKDNPPDNHEKPAHDVEVADINDDSDIMVNRGALNGLNGEVQASPPDNSTNSITMTPFKPVPKKRTKINKDLSTIASANPSTTMEVRAETETEENAIEITEVRIKFQ